MYSIYIYVYGLMLLKKELQIFVIMSLWYHNKVTSSLALLIFIFFFLKGFKSSLHVIYECLLPIQYLFKDEETKKSYP